MKVYHRWWTIGSVVFPLFFCLACKKSDPKKNIPTITTSTQDSLKRKPIPPKNLKIHLVKEDVLVGNYFEYMDKLLINESWRVHYPLSEHLIVWANPWIIDTLENTDYYRLKEKGIINDNQQKMTALRKGAKLIIPDSLMGDSIQKRLNAMKVDVNIPEFKLRILENDKILYTFPIRVGKHTDKFLAMAGRTLSLETKPGTGKILQVNKNAEFRNPVNNKRYYKTHRDDGQYTELPRVPWLIPEINHQIYGQLIHPTTNPISLGKPSSNGCIGMKEADIWRVYYYAPIGTPITIRYDLEVIDEKGDTLHLPDIYKH